jgi:aminodeoxyfutalosine synthase
MIKKAQMPLEDGLRKLKEYGLDSLPGGGAEIFAHEVRSQICDDKASSESWLTIHETAHKVGLPSNATMLYGHIENYAHRVDHMAQLRALQDKTGGFNTFIPLKYRSQNNGLSHLGEVNTSEDLRNYAVSRLFLDNFPHIKAYWPMIGKGTTQLSLSFGVNDIDGTIDDSTKIYSMAGVEDKNPALSTADLVALVKAVGRQAIERDTVYNELVAY